MSIKLTKSMKKVLQRVPLNVSLHWRYLHQNGKKNLVGNIKDEFLWKKL